MIISDRALAQIKAHAAQEYARGRESCGVLMVVSGKHQYMPCRNTAVDSDRFQIDPMDWAAAEDAGDICAIVHSHPNASPKPSQADLVECERSGLPWVIVGWPTGAVQIVEPSGYTPDLIGRRFFHGVLDCYTLIRDYYRKVVGIEIPEYARDSEWWLKGQSLYLDGFKSAGFVLVEAGPLQQHDVLLMQIASPVPNHAAVWIGGGKILHHMMNRLSTREVYGGWYQKCHTHTVRHASLA